MLAVVMGHAASAESPDKEVRLNFQQLMETNSCPNCNLAGAMFNRIDLSGADLAGANLAGAQMYLATLAGANLQNSNLQGAGLGGADLAGADLRGANLTGAVLEGAYLVGAQMDGTVTTKRPYVEEGGPDAGELVYVDDEAHSKNLPFTNKAHVADAQNMETAAKTEQDVVLAEVDGAAGKSVQAKQELPVEQNVARDVFLEQEPETDQSKTLVMMADAVLPEDSQGEEPEDAKQVTPPVESSHQVSSSEGELQTPQESAAVKVPAVVMAEPEEVASAPAMAESLQVTDKEVLQDQAVAEEVPVQEPSSTAMPAAEQSKQKMAEAEQMPAGPPENSAVVEEVEVQPASEPEQMVVLEKDTVVAEMASPDTDLAPVESEVSGQQVDSEMVATMEENIADMEKAAGDIAEAEVQDPVQEEVLPAEQMQRADVPGPVAAEAVVPEQAPAPVTETEKAATVAEAKKKMMVEKLLDDNRCVECDLSGVDLSGRHLDEADLERVNLQGANLSGADLSEANLKSADLRGANLQNADLREADLYRANLSEADLTGARFEEALIDMVYSAGSIGANFEGAVQEE